MSCSSASAATELVGLRFNPTDHELISHYLNNMLQAKHSYFPQFHCCKHEPWDLLALLNKDMGGCFFSPRDYKYGKSKRSNRATQQGFWKITGKPRPIKDPDTQVVIGFKKTMTFHIGRGSNSQNTNYVMHEYDVLSQNGDFVLCRLKCKLDKSHNKKMGSPICEEADPNSYMASEFQNLPAAVMIAGQDKELEDPQLPSCNDISILDYGFSGFSSDSDMFLKQQGVNQESLIHPTPPHQQQDYCSFPLPKEAKWGYVPPANVNNGDSSWGQSPLGGNHSCLTNKNKHEPVSNMVSNFGSAADDSILEVFTQPGENLEPPFYPLLQDSPPPMPTEPRDVLPGNNNIARNESQSQIEDWDFSLTQFLLIDGQEKQNFLPSTPTNQDHLEVGTHPPSIYSLHTYSALATGVSPVS